MHAPLIKQIKTTPYFLINFTYALTSLSNTFHPAPDSEYSQGPSQNSTPFMNSSLISPTWFIILSYEITYGFMLPLGLFAM